MIRGRARAAGIALVVTASACSSPTEKTAQAPIKKSSADWNMLGYDVGSTYWNSGETKITKKSAAKLEKAWEFDGGGQVTGTPVIAAGKVYVASQGLQSIDLVTGAVLWANADAPASSSSLAISNGVLYMSDSNGVIRAFKSEDGSQIWEFTTPNADGAAGFASPIVTKDFVVYALSTNEEILNPEGGPTFRGFVGALNKDGSMAWQRYTVTGDEHGATIWSTPSVDEALGLVYAATGNNHGAPAGTTSDAFVAVPLKDGGDFTWTRQIFEGDIWTSVDTGSPDSDFGANPIVFDAGGKKLVAGGNKGGDFWVLERDTGTLVQKRHLGPGTAFKGGVFVSGAWDGKRLLVVCNGATSTEPGSEVGEAAAGLEAVLYALDPLTLDIAWSRQVIGPVYSPITVANGVGFFGKDKTLQAFDTETGEVIHEFATEGTIATAPAISNGYVVFGSGMTWLQGTPGTKYYALKVP